MISSERQSYAIDSLSDSQTYIEEQAEFFRQWLKALNLEKITVDSTSSVKSPEELLVKDHPTFGYIGAFSADGSFTTFLATGENQHIATYFLTATDENSGLLADDTTEILYTDSFWRLHQGKLQHIIPTIPIPLDGLMMCWDGKEDIDPIVKSLYTQTTLQIIQAGANKITTKEILSAKGIPVPGEPKEGDLRVGKFALGAYGESVILEEVGKPEEYEVAMARLRSKHDPKLIFEEQRIIPAPNAPLAALLEPPVPPDRIDYSRRHIYTLGENPFNIITFVKFGERNDRPVSSSLNSSDKAALLETMQNPTLSRNSEHTARNAVREIFKANYTPGDTRSSPMFIGVDTIDDNKHDRAIGSVRTLVSEIQPYPGVTTLLAANLGELFFRRAPLLITHQMSSVRKHFEQRPAVTSNTLRRIPYISSAQDNIYTSRSERIKLQKVRGVKL